MYRQSWFAGGSDHKDSASNAGDLGPIPMLEGAPGERNVSDSSIPAWGIP